MVFLSPTPISTLEITQRLDISKGLASRAINELLEHRLIIKESENSDHCRHTYLASEDVGNIVRKTLETRELVLLEKNYKALVKLASNSAKELGTNGVSPEKVQWLLELTGSNKSLLKDFLKKKFKKIPDWIKLSKRARMLMKF